MAALIAFVGSMIAAGYALRRLGLVRAEAARDLSQMVFYFTLPPLIFQALHKAQLTWSLLLMPAVAWGLVLGGTALGLWLCRLFKVSRDRAGALIIVTVFGNTTFFGYPVAQGFFGERGLALAIFFDLLGASIATNTVAVLLASTMGGGDKKVGAKEIARQLALLPPIWALVLGLALHGVEIPTALGTILDQIGNLTSPLIMLSIGLSLQLKAWREDLGLVLLASLGKLVVLPAIVLLVVVATGMPTDLKQIAVLQSAMPTMFFSLTLALSFGLRMSLVVNAIMVSTLLSFATLPIWGRILGQ
jgi:auxin efflux carrier (AEC)